MGIHDYTMQSIDGKATPLAEYAGKWMLMINVASQCGLTPQYSGLEALYRKYADKGLVILGFPCNQFGAQEPGTDADVKQFCETMFQVSFPLFSKIEVNGPTAHPLYRELATTLPGAEISEEARQTDRMAKFLAAQFPDFLAPEAIRWNFTKFLVDPNGVPVKRYEPAVAPEQIDEDLASRLS